MHQYCDNIIQVSQRPDLVDFAAEAAEEAGLPWPPGHLATELDKKVCHSFPVVLGVGNFFRSNIRSPLRQTLPSLAVFSLPFPKI